MPSPDALTASLSLLTDARTAVRTVAASLEALARRDDIPPDVARALAANTATLRAIGGPTDPTVGA